MNMPGTNISKKKLTQAHTNSRQVTFKYEIRYFALLKIQKATSSKKQTVNI